MPGIAKMKPVEINLSDTFTHLSKAPIAEAVLEIRARAGGEWVEETISAALKAQLPEYPGQEERNAYVGSFEIRSGQEPQHALEDLGWCGITVKSEDSKQIAFFERDRFLFSRLEPYGTWEHFLEEAMRLWDIHRTLAHPESLERLGLRFINRLPLPETDMEFGKYLQVAPKEPEGLSLPFSGFLHQDMLVVPGHNYRIKITRAVQKENGTSDASAGLIIDVDVFTTEPVPLENANLEKCISEMRWLENKAFFGTISQRLKDELT